MHEMGLQLELTLSRNSPRNILQRNKKLMSKMSKKRNFEQAFEFDNEEDEVNSIDVVPQTLPLFVWKDKDEDEDDDSNDKHVSLVHFNKINVEEETGVVGWPPIRSWIKHVRYHRGNGGGGGDVGGGGNSMYVKVMMEGFGIGRKVDLSLHHSFETLTYTLILMFQKYCKNGQSYRLTYQDKEGDWLLAGDVPWGKNKILMLHVIENYLQKFRPHCAKIEIAERMETKSIIAERATTMDGPSVLRNICGDIYRLFLSFR